MSVLAVNFLIWKAEKGWINLLPACSTAYGYMTGRPFLLCGKRACVWIWSLSRCPRPMDQLSAYGAHLGLSKSEFTHQLEHHPASSLRSLRTLYTYWRSKPSKPHPCRASRTTLGESTWLRPETCHQRTKWGYLDYLSFCSKPDHHS